MTLTKHKLYRNSTQGNRNPSNMARTGTLLAGQLEKGQALLHRTGGLPLKETEFTGLQRHQRRALWS